jgi:hypothetical protein
MSQIEQANVLVKPIVAILSRDKGLVEEAIPLLESHFGRCDFRSPWHSFSHSSYYEAEMGSGLERCMLAFEKLCPEWEAAKFKEWTYAIEERFAEGGHRIINCDPGYVDQIKVVLMSGKSGRHKIAVAEDIWADLLLWYNKGWVPSPWAFPDFRDGTYFEDFLEIRRMFKKAVPHD